jgi:hypothetical protein
MREREGGERGGEGGPAELLLEAEVLLLAGARRRLAQLAHLRRTRERPTCECACALARVGGEGGVSVQAKGIKPSQGRYSLSWL